MGPRLRGSVKWMHSYSVAGHLKCRKLPPWLIITKAPRVSAISRIYLAQKHKVTHQKSVYVHEMKRPKIQRERRCSTAVIGKTKVGKILVAADRGLFLGARLHVFLSLIPPGMQHCSPLYRWHLWGPERLRHSPHYVAVGGRWIWSVCLQSPRPFHCCHSLPQINGKSGRADAVGSWGVRAGWGEELPMTRSDSSEEAGMDDGKWLASGANAHLLAVMWG